MDAIRWLDVEVRWTECATRADALVLESAAVEILKFFSIWNRIASRAASQQRVTQMPTSRSSDSEEEFSGTGEQLASETVAELTREFADKDGGRAVRRALRAGFPDHVKGDSWDPLTVAQVAHVRMMRSR